MNFLTFLKYATRCFAGLFTLALIGSASQYSQTHPGTSVEFVLLLLLSLLGLPALIIAKRKKLNASTFKLWLYTTFIPVVSWIDILLQPSKASSMQSNIESTIDVNKSLLEEKKMTSIEQHSIVDASQNPTRSPYFKDYQVQWERWEMEHTKPEQIKRWDRALRDCSIMKIIDEKHGVALVKGIRGGEYITSLTMCNCSDFAKRHKPCKHMYNLAKYLGVFSVFDF